MGFVVGVGWQEQVHQQIPFGNDRQKSKSKSKGGWAFVVGVGWQEQGQQQIPFGNDRQKSKGNGKSKSNCKGNNTGKGSRGSFDCVGRKGRVQLRSR